MIYLSYCSQTYASKNQLQEQVKTLLLNQSRKMIYAEDLEDFKSKLTGAIDALNKKHPRCQPVKISFHTAVDRGNSEAVDQFISWNDHRGFNGHKLCEFRLLASR